MPAAAPTADRLVAHPRRRGSRALGPPDIDAPGARQLTLTVVDVHPGEAFNELEPFTDLAITNVFFTAAT